MFEKIAATVLKVSNTTKNFFEEKGGPVKAFVATKSDQLKEQVDTELYKQTLKRGFKRTSKELIEELVKRQEVPSGFTNKESELFKAMLEFYNDLKEFE